MEENLIADHVLKMCVSKLLIVVEGITVIEIPSYHYLAENRGWVGLGISQILLDEYIMVILSLAMLLEIQLDKLG